MSHFRKNYKNSEKNYVKAVRNLKHVVVEYMLTIENLENTNDRKGSKNNPRPQHPHLYNSEWLHGILFHSALYSTCASP